MDFTVNGAPLRADIEQLTVAGWTGRDASAIQHHIDELAALGVVPPSSVPLYYRVSADQMTQAAHIQVVGGGTSGEVEPFLLSCGGKLYIGLSSDHTDRDLETHSVALSKQICAKPVAGELWVFDEISERLESLELRSWIREDASADWMPYQEGTIASIRPLADLMSGSGFAAALAEGSCQGLLCGTFGAKGGVRPAAAFRMEMRDPGTGRVISHEYTIEVLPAVA